MSVETLPHGHAPDQAPDQAPVVSRRALALSAAWATPVVLVAVTAPAYAATSGQCPDYGLADLGAVGSKPGSLLLPPSSNKATISLQRTDSKGNVLALDDATGSVATTDYTPGWSYLMLHHAKGMRQGDIITLTLSLDDPVENLTLTVTDIDKIKGEWIDQVYTSPVAIASAQGPNVVGSGTSADPFTSKVNAEIHTAAGDLTLTWPGPLSVVQLFFRVGDTKNTSTRGQHVGVGKIGFDGCE
ncbi:MAG TPA: hypothetical protein VH085_07535 [Nocardioides sp.]|nr:hypothetical protein [Nocardioides sp.]